MKIKALTQPKAVLYPTAAAIITCAVLSGCQQQLPPTIKTEQPQYINGLMK